MLYKNILYKKRPIPNLTFGSFKKALGRNNTGKISIRAKVKLNKLKYRLIDFKRILWNLPALVIRVEYDPYRTAFIALLSYINNVISYIICPNNLIPGTIIYTGLYVPLKEGNSTILKCIKPKVKIHNIEIFPGSKAKYIRSAGTYAEILEKFVNFCVVRFNSGHIKQFSIYCMATIGVVSNIEKKFLKFKKASDSYYKKKKKSIVRGVAKNAVDHPHGGGKGKKSPKKISFSPWKKLGKGIKTVKK